MRIELKKDGYSYLLQLFDDKNKKRTGVCLFDDFDEAKDEAFQCARRLARIRAKGQPFDFDLSEIVLEIKF